jgi:hypothetical protein
MHIACTGFVKKTGSKDWIRQIQYSDTQPPPQVAIPDSSILIVNPAEQFDFGKAIGGSPSAS